MDDLLREFLNESHESLDRVDAELVRFERNPADRAMLDHIFRLVHTIKGTCGFLGLPRLEQISHASETLMSRFRDGDVVATPDAVTAILSAIDRIKEILDHLEAENAEPDGDDQDLINRLHTFSSGQCAGPADAAASVNTGKKDSLAESATYGLSGGTVRVSVDVLESLMTMVSELVLTRNQLSQTAQTVDEDAFQAPLQRLSAITAELQANVMRTRMQPVGHLWKKLPRLLRDIARDLGKTIELNIEGEATELDRQIAELIKTPLMHMVRNAADHGLETPEERRAAGKPEAGTITLRASHEGGRIVIVVADDGRGLDTDRIRQKAVAKGLVTADEAARMPESAIQAFIFASGFSTAESVTLLSGRGVGMDVVRTHIAHIGGQIDLISTPGQGTTFILTIPLTLAIISALLVRVGAQCFALPQTDVLELLRIGDGSMHMPHTCDGRSVLHLRDQILPLTDTACLLGLDRGAAEGAARYAVVMAVGGKQFGVVVDEICDTQEIVTQPLPGALQSAPLYSGATILGDGSVVMILDPQTLVPA